MHLHAIAIQHFPRYVLVDIRSVMLDIDDLAENFEKYISFSLSLIIGKSVSLSCTFPRWNYSTCHLAFDRRRPHLHTYT
jgi:hypothetical protein